ncbi:flagellar hook-basal body complex protein FliE [Desulfatibacillum aliphaticivorans]|uniref:Flagellar hook-basal body complex protein FliE n=1 Tax=Desulfatibacillum aliphaticivorans TaxID=218208 RepID=B8FJU3_DESAL|nr:flagellar hook-basal body complex protein FliE [Desulfatibacillum aliphaticivorans]ACL02371.1 Flagellar hook-basal body complex subunit FliE [Desulfatibacillum aliphaticivorans]
MNGVTGVGGQSVIAQEVKKAAAGEDGSFGSVLKKMVDSVNESQIKADDTVVQNLDGKTGIHEAMIALQEADINIRFLLQVRNKALDAYREIMRMPF